MPSPSQLQDSGGFPPTPPLFSFRLRRGGRCQKADKNDFETDTISEGARVSSLRDEHDFDEDGKGDDSEKGRKDEEGEKGEKNEIHEEGEKEEQDEKENDGIDKHVKMTKSEKGKLVMAKRTTTTTTTTTVTSPLMTTSRKGGR